MTSNYYMCWHVPRECHKLTTMEQRILTNYQPENKGVEKVFFDPMHGRRSLYMV